MAGTVILWSFLFDFMWRDAASPKPCVWHEL